MNVIVQESKQGKFTQTITVGSHQLTADESVASGGNDLGPSPYDFLLTALGTCTSMTIRMYANFKKIPLENIVVTLSHQKDYVQDCTDCENPHSKIERIERRIKLEGTLTEEQRQTLLEIANKCPVHRTLTSKILIDTQLVKN